MDHVSGDDIMRNNDMATSIASLDDKFLFSPKLCVGTPALESFLKKVNWFISPSGKKRRPLFLTVKKSDNQRRNDRTSAHVLVQHSIAKGEIVRDWSLRLFPEAMNPGNPFRESVHGDSSEDLKKETSLRYGGPIPATLENRRVERSINDGGPRHG